MRTLYLLFFLPLLFSCAGIESESGDVRNADSVLFREFLELVPDITLPMEINCGFVGGINEIDRSKYKKFLPDNYANVIGKKYWKSGNFNILFYGVIGDIIYPYAYTYNHSGSLIDSLYLHYGYCGDSENESDVSYTIIEKDMTMLMIDTIYKYWYKENDTGYVNELYSLIIAECIKKIDNTGHFYLVSCKDSISFEITNK